jgi:hypothetical protein
VPKLKILGWLYAGLSALVLIIGFGLCIGLLFDPDPRSLPALEFVGPLFLMIALVTAVPGLIGGVGLIIGRSWARIPVVIASLALLFLFPIGTLIAVFAFYVLYDAERHGAPTPPAKPAPSSAPLAKPLSAAVQQELGDAGGVLLAMAGVGAGFIVAIGAGFRITEQAAPAPLDSLFYPAIVVLLLVVGVATWRFVNAPGRSAAIPRARFNWFERHKLSGEREGGAEERRQRLFRLAADPATRKYVALIENGQAWSDEQIVYNEDRAKTVTCTHLAPIERAMRGAGIDVRLTYGANATSFCLIDEAELAQKFGALAPARYVEYISGDRSLEDPPNAALTCSVCNSTIRVLHRVEANLQTPLFPSPVAK